MQVVVFYLCFGEIVMTQNSVIWLSDEIAKKIEYAKLEQEMTIAEVVELIT